MVKIYIPNQGDVVYFNFSPAEGREQKGLRPGLVMSRAFFNERSGMALICPITSKQKHYPFEVIINTEAVSGVALIDQVRAIDYLAREFKFISHAGDLSIEEAKAKFLSLIQ